MPSHPRVFFCRYSTKAATYHISTSWNWLVFLCVGKSILVRYTALISSSSGDWPDMRAAQLTGSGEKSNATWAVLRNILLCSIPRQYQAIATAAKLKLNTFCIPGTRYMYVYQVPWYVGYYLHIKYMYTRYFICTSVFVGCAYSESAWSSTLITHKHSPKGRKTRKSRKEETMYVAVEYCSPTQSRF